MLKALLAGLSMLPIAASFAATGLPKAEKAQAKADAKQEKDEETKLVLESLAKRYGALGNWGADFFQTEKSPGFAQEIQSEGFFKFVHVDKEDKFLLETTNDNVKKRFVSNGHGAIYIEDKGAGKKDRYFTRRFTSARDLERFLLFFRGLKKNNGSDADFDVKGAFKKPLLEVTLKPKQDSDFTEIKIVFENENNFPKLLTFLDAVGGETTLKLTRTYNIKPSEIKKEWFDTALPADAKDAKKADI